MKKLYFISLLLLFVGCTQNLKSTKDGQKIKIHALLNKELILKDDLIVNYEIKDNYNDSLLIIIKDKGTIFTDYNNYENLYDRIVYFYIPKNFTHLKYADDELKDINAIFIWNVYSDSILRKKDGIKKGNIEISQNENTLSIIVDVITESDFGGFLSKKSSNQLKLKMMDIKIE